MTVTTPELARRKMAESLPEPLRSHAHAMLDAGFNPSRISKYDVYLCEDAESVEVTTLVESATAFYLVPGRTVIVPISERHVWWHDFESPLPRILNP